MGVGVELGVGGSGDGDGVASGRVAVGRTGLGDAVPVGVWPGGGFVSSDAGVCVREGTRVSERAGVGVEGGGEILVLAA